MLLCRNQEEVASAYFTNVNFRENRISFKRYANEDRFIKSVLIPTSKYPLPNDDMEIFTADNTEQLTDKQYIEIIDGCTYEIGKCYTNIDRMRQAFLEKDITTFQPYVGWMFIGKENLPVFHCWGVLEDKYLIDLSDDSDTLYGLNGQLFVGLTKEQQRDRYVEYMAEAVKQKHSIRCYPLGKAGRILFYIGCKCEPTMGRALFWELMKKYPNHESYIKTNQNGATSLQQRLLDNNLGKMQKSETKQKPFRYLLGFSFC